MNDILLYLAVKYEGDFNKIFKAIMEKEHCNDEDVRKVVKSIKCKYTTVISSDYPERLKKLNHPPFVLFYEGDLSLINKKNIAVIGSRENTEYGKIMTEKVINSLVYNEYVIISGLAKGIDYLAHIETLKRKGKTIAVLGNGIDYYYPLENKDVQDQIKKEGLLISEYPPLTKPQKYNFPNRNRIIAALCDAVLVVESKTLSGTMTTVNEALALGKDIMCFPERATENSGCNQLIKSGAYLVDSIDDIFEITKLC